MYKVGCGLMLNKSLWLHVVGTYRCVLYNVHLETNLSKGGKSGVGLSKGWQIIFRSHGQQNVRGRL